MPRGVYERKNKKAKTPRAVNSRRSAAIKQSWARRKRKLKTDAKLAAETRDHFNGMHKAEPTEQQALPLASPPTDPVPTHAEIMANKFAKRSNELSALLVTTEVMILRRLNDLDSVIQDEHTGVTVRLALKHISDSFLNIAESVGESRQAIFEAA